MTVKQTVSAKEIKERILTNLGEKGLKIRRLFTKNKNDIYKGIDFELRTSKITNTDGSTVFEMKNVEVPSFWSQVATDVLAQKYFRKKGVPQYDSSGKQILDNEGKPILGSENSIKQVASRMAATWRWWGEKYGYFNGKSDADAFEDEANYMIVAQMAVPNSPQWFNTGLAHSYNINGAAQGHYYGDPITGEIRPSEDAYTHPQPHACFIQNVDDDLVNEGGIFDLLVKEARLFKYGSGTGTNFSKLRGKGEMLSGGGTSSGLMSFLKVLDAGAGSIKSGGTTRRAAKMVILDIDHPEIEDFIYWKVKEEQKVASLVVGSHINYKHLTRIFESAEQNGIDPEKNPQLKELIIDAKKDFVPLNYIKRILMMVENGINSSKFTYEVYDTDFRSEAYVTVDGQNSNNSVRLSEEFLEAVEQDKNWDLIARTTGEIFKTLRARDLWEKIGLSAWSSADPGLQYHTTINEWHTCPVDGEIRASNPCSEYMFLDETACNLYQINLGKFYDERTGKFDEQAFIHCVRICTIILEVSVLMSQLPSRTMAIGTFKYRTLGLGYANLGSLLMKMGLPYEGEEGYAMTAVITAIMTGEAYATSAEMAKVKGPFERYKANSQQMLKVIRNHRRAAYNASKSEYENLTIYPRGISSKYIEPKLYQAALRGWDYALELGKSFGYRNAQVTCLAPTGTTGLVMDCDTTGLEPDFALVKFKKLVGGGYFKIVNQSIKPALKKLGYMDEEIKAIIQYVVGRQTLKNAPFVNHETLKAKGFTEEIISRVEILLSGIFELKYAFTKWTLGEKFCTDALGLAKEKLDNTELNVLEMLGFTKTEIEKANEYVCGTMTVEGAPYLQDKHLCVFDCANKCGIKGKRFISMKGHIYQMAAAQPFLSGSISKTINMPEEATIDDIQDAYMTSWKVMLKSNSIYRDSSKLSQPLNSVADPNGVYAKLFDFAEDDADAEVKLNTELVHKTIQTIAQSGPIRKRLPDERHSITHKFKIAGHSGYITVGLYESGKPGEIFITMNKQGSTLSGIMDSWATVVSFSLQYGVPLEELIRKMVFSRFEPAGPTSNPEIPVAQSIMDYIGKWLALKFLPKERAKLYHNEMLVDMSHDSGTNKRILIPFINGKGHTEIKDHELDTAVDHEIKEGLKKDASNAALDQVAMDFEAAHTSSASSVKITLGDDFTRMQKEKAFAQNNEDAPLCAECGSITVRNGSCYKCMECGSTTGCS